MMHFPESLTWNLGKSGTSIKHCLPQKWVLKQCFQEGMSTERADPTSEEAKVQKDCRSWRVFDMLISYQMHLAKVQNHSLENREEEKI